MPPSRLGTRWCSSKLKQVRVAMLIFLLVEAHQDRRFAVRLQDTVRDMSNVATLAGSGFDTLIP